MDIYRSKFGKRLREARKRIPNLSQERLAEIVGVEGPSVSRWETGKDFPDESRLPLICKALGVSSDYFELPEQIIHQDPLPEWAANISNRLAALESASSSPATQLTPDQEKLLKSWQAARPPFRAAIQYLLSGDEADLALCEKTIRTELKILRMHLPSRKVSNE